MAAHGQADEYVVNKLKMKGRRRIILSGRRIRGLTPAFSFRGGVIIEKSFMELLSVARLFLQKKATIGQLRKAVREAEESLRRDLPAGRRD